MNQEQRAEIAAHLKLHERKCKAEKILAGWVKMYSGWTPPSHSQDFMVEIQECIPSESAERIIRAMIPIVQAEADRLSLEADGMAFIPTEMRTEPKP